MQYIIGLGIGTIICYFLIIGGVLVVLANMLTALKLIFSNDIEKYGTNFSQVYQKKINESKRYCYNN